MRIDDAIEIKNPAPDSHFRLRSCQHCGGDAVYVKYLDKGAERWRAQCVSCRATAGMTGPASLHDIQTLWNGMICGVSA